MQTSTLCKSMNVAPTTNLLLIAFRQISMGDI